MPLPPLRFVAYLGLTGAIWIAIAWLMARYTDAAAPWQDTAVASLSVLAQFLLSRRNPESWLVWIAVDLLAIELFISRGLMPTAALYGVFLCLAVAGWLQWRRAPRQKVA
ncbi:MAG: nicotinamide riboside transporter PnuC [Paracoccus sp. (in: a-proteobacteria)]